MGRQQYEQFCLRFSPDNPQHVKVLRILNNLDRDLYKSKTQFIMEAIESYICRLSEGMETADEDEKKKYVTSEELEVMENRIREELRKELYQDFVVHLADTMMTAMVRQPAVVQSAPIEKETVSISYVGRRECSLFNPLNWFERIANDVGGIWKSEGCLMLNLSEYASKIGDNRAFVEIGGSVASVAGKMGATSLLQFVNMVKESEIDWKELTFDGIISALETNYFTEEELLEIWKKATSYFRLDEHAGQYDNQNTRRKIYCADIHKAISLCAKRLKYKDFENKMSIVAPLEYAQERLEQSEHSCIIPSRWYESEYNAYMDEFISKTKKMTLSEMFDYIEVQFGKGNFYWDYIKYFIQRAQSKNSQCITDYKLRIMKILEKREINNLEYDGCNRLYTVLFPYLNDGEVINVLKQVIDTYYHQKSKGWISTEYGLMNDLDNFTFALFSRFPVEDNIWGLHEILKMHCLWLNGTENLKVKEIYHLEEVSMVENWCEFFNQLERCVSFSTLFGA